MKVGWSEAQRGEITTRPGPMDLAYTPPELSICRYPGSSSRRSPGKKYLAQRYITLLYGMPEYDKMRKLARTRGQEQEISNKIENLPADDATWECANK